MSRFRYCKIDAFTSTHSSGNPAACLYLEPGQALSEAEMLAIAREHKGFVSEVVYCTSLAGDCFRLAYYSSECEVDFCGHGTIACMYHLLGSRAELAARPQVEIVTKMGALAVYNELAALDAVLITAPSPAYPGAPVGAAEAAAALGLAPADLDPVLDVDMINAGLNTLLVPVATLERELGLAPDEAALKQFCLGHGIDIVLAFSREVFAAGHIARSRVFAPKFGYLEDKATGSGNSALGYYLLARGLWGGGPASIEQNGEREGHNVVRLATAKGGAFWRPGPPLASRANTCCNAQGEEFMPVNETDRYDVVVCGGGIAGIAAALASARSGARTCLLEKEYALGGLATLGLIVIYLPLCDGDGVLMSGGIAEELLYAALRYGPGQIPAAWRNPAATLEERAVERYQVEYNAASLMIAAEELLLAAGVRLFYDARLAAVRRRRNGLAAVAVETKLGRREFAAKAFVDATGDADVCYLAGEATVDDDTNRRTGWFYSFDGQALQLHPLTDPIYADIPSTSRLYSGTRLEDIAQHCIDGRRMILARIQSLREAGNAEVYPLLIPAFHGLRMTRRLAGAFEFSEDEHERVWFTDAIGMIGNWKHRHKRYAIPYRCLRALANDNLYVAGRCVCADKSGWDLTRVIPSCAVTGQAAGTAAALQAGAHHAPDAAALQACLRAAGVPLDPSLFVAWDE